MELVQAVKRFARDEEGVTAIEYGLIAGIVAVSLIASLEVLRDALMAIFDSVATALSAASGG